MALAEESILIAPEGELDVTTVGEFRAALSTAAREAQRGLVVDLSSVSFIDSSGLGALVECYRRLQRDNRTLAVVAPGGTAAALLLNLAGLQTRVPIYATRQDALGAWPRPTPG